MAQAQIVFKTSIEKQPHPLAAHGPQGQAAGSKAIKGQPLDVMNTGIAPIQRSRIHHVGVRDQTSGSCSKKPGSRQTITGITTELTADARGYQQQGGQW